MSPFPVPASFGTQSGCGNPTVGTPASAAKSPGGNRTVLDRAANSASVMTEASGIELKDLRGTVCIPCADVM